MFHNPTKNSMEKQETLSVKCKNCGVIYTLKSGAPEICWICGCPTDEEMFAQ